MKGSVGKRSGSENGRQDHEIKKKRPSSAIMGITRSIAACKRCRVKKIKCDQRFPSCSKCATSNEPCVSVDPATGRDVPRSYVVFLEDRLEAMVKKLQECGVDPTQVQGNIPATEGDYPCDLGLFEEKLRAEHEVPHENAIAGYIINNGTSMKKGVMKSDKPAVASIHSLGLNDSDRLEPVSELGESAKNLQSLGSMKYSHQKSGEPLLGAASNSYLGDSSGIPFAKLIFTAINFMPDAVEEASKHVEDEPTEEDDSLLDTSYLPPKPEAQILMSQYFTCSNAQLPILHREYFLKRFFEPIYGLWNSDVSLSSDTTLINSNFQLPLGKNDSDTQGDVWYEPSLSQLERDPREVPVKFHIPLFFLNIVMAIGDSSKVMTSDERKSVAFKNRASAFNDALFRSDDQMEALAGTLLVAQYSTMRPNVPGVWYTMGSALRLAVDLGLHAEKLNRNYDPFTRDMRRRLLWCTYSLDRQICAFFGRPFGIPDENITSEFPSSLDDALITTTADDIEDYSMVKSSMASYKCVALAFFKIRKVQADIVQVLYSQKEIPDGFEDLDEWKEHMNRQLDEWHHKKVPKTSRKMNCDFKLELFQLELFHSKVLLYGLCPKSMTLNEHGYKMVYHNTKGIIDVYYKLCREENIMYTWVAVHSLFMSGMTFLYVLHNAGVVIGDTIQELQKTCLKLVYVMEQLDGKCEAAKKGSIIFKVLSAAILKLRVENVGNVHESSPHEVRRRESDGSVLTLDEQSHFNRVNSLGEDVFAPGVDPGALNQFFVELDKLSPFSDLSNDLDDLAKTYATDRLTLKDSKLPIALNIDPSVATDCDDSEQNRDAPGLPLKANHSQTNTNHKDGQRVYDMMNQFSTETIWDQVFSNGGMSGVTLGNQEH
ncbi:LANO_0H08944g1_1 [Lachancea nothofagi CBS 11611]|uniref:LANO_0H08944g1_1 n=1 Tax=Lachancea nothofagi CBS 11611 TaxID=1266666 RepID=A0A1G4KM15_9SACH|nr:LANO_0H08944g1_1 [Lachancea nothofagi CBS 11611]